MMFEIIFKGYIIAVFILFIFSVYLIRKNKAKGIILFYISCFLIVIWSLIIMMIKWKLKKIF